MKLISSYLAGQKLQFKVYENVAEAEEAGIIVKPLNLAKEGDYVLSDNGYYLPVIKRVIIQTKDKKRQTVKLQLPRSRYLFSLDKDGNLPKKYNFIYDITGQKRKFRSLSIRSKAFANFINQGMDIFKAYKAAYGNRQGSHVYSAKLLDDISNPLFIKYLKEIGFMINNDKLDKSGMSEDFLLEQMKNLIVDKQEPYQLRKWALETLFGLHEAASVPNKTNDIKPKVLDEVDSIMKRAIPEAVLDESDSQQDAQIQNE